MDEVKMGKTLLFGNGLNRAECETEDVSWESLLNNLSELCENKRRVDLKLVNNSLYYEENILKTNHNEIEIKKYISNRLNNMEPNSIVEKLVELKFEHFITTNYDFALEKAFKKEFNNNSDNDEKIYSIRRRYHVGEPQRNIWHIHGDIKNEKSIMLGYDHYCGYISKINQYVKGSYEYRNNKIESMEEKVKYCDKIGKEKELEFYNKNMKSWIDLFFTTNVHIIGFGLDYNEIDIWWLLNKRARMIGSGIPIKNEIVFYGDLNENIEKKSYLESFGVTIQNKNNNESFFEFYNRILDNFID